MYTARVNLHAIMVLDTMIYMIYTITIVTFTRKRAPFRFDESTRTLTPYRMNEQQLQKSERIASKIMRVLAIVGLVSLLGFIAWLVVQFASFVPNAGERMSAAVSSVQSIFGGAPEESITLTPESRTFTSGKDTVVRWEYTGEIVPTSYRFSYSCADGVTMSMQANGGLREIPCDTPTIIEGTSITVRPISQLTRFADTELTIDTGTKTDTTLVTIVNADNASVSATSTPVVASTTPDVVKKPTVSAPVVSKPTTPVVTKPRTSKPTDVAKPTPTTRPVVAQPTIPADLIVNIEETGILARVSGKNQFFPVSPIPSDKTAGFTFTVTNRGGKASGAWAFKANLPIEGDADYTYVSPAQASLAPGMQVLFTLGFDEVLDAKSGTVRVEITPTDKTDKASNNVDAVKVSIK
jgi:hypothetical protein